MRQDEARKIVLETLEVYTELQRKAIQELKGMTPEVTRPASRGGRRRQSLVDMCYNVLTERGTPMHVSDLVEALFERFDRVTDRDAVSSALGKKARQGILFEQTAPATFAAISDEQQPGR